MPRGRATRAPPTWVLLIASPLLFGIPVALGIVVSVIRLVGLRYPYLGWAATVNNDAEELYLGHTLYQNPAHGYTGQVYTPLFPFIASLFDHLYLWHGWLLVMTIGATVSLTALASWMAYARAGPAPRLIGLLGAAGVGCIAYWCVAGIALPVLDEGRADQLAWAFALFGLVAVADFGPAPSWRRTVTAALLLSAGIWTKQTTIVIAGLAVAWVFGLSVLRALSRKAVLLFAATFFGLNLALLLVLNILTHGWEFYFNFELATRQAIRYTYGENVINGLRSSALAIGFVGFAWLVGIAHAIYLPHQSWSSHRHKAISRLRRLLVSEDPTGRRILLLGLYIVSGFAFAAYLMRKQGTETNQVIGVVWALGLLAATGWRVAQRHIGTAVAAGGCVALFFVLTQLGPIDRLAANADVKVPALERAEQWLSSDPELISWAHNHTLYLPFESDLNVPNGGPLYDNYLNFADVLAAGDQPLYLVHALLDRRFESVGYIPLGEEAYTSAYGKWEENYLWKLDEVIRERYTEVNPEAPEGMLERRPGPERAAWMRHCFGPFAAAGVSFRIRHGGGFWCSSAPGRLRLVRTPAPLSEVVTTQAVHLTGTIAVSLKDRRTSQVSLVSEGGPGARWMVHIVPVPERSDDLVVSTYVDKKLLTSRRVNAKGLSGGRREIKLSMSPTSANPGRFVSVDRGAATLTAPSAAAPFAVLASSGAALNLQAMRLSH